MSSFRVNKDKNEEGSRKYGPPLRDTDLLGPSPYSTFLTKSPPPDGDNKLVLANGNTLPYIAASYSSGILVNETSYSIELFSNPIIKYELNFITESDSLNPQTLPPLENQLFGNDTTFTIPTLVVTPTTANTTSSFTYDTNNKVFIITLTDPTGNPTTGSFNFIAFASS